MNVADYIRKKQRSDAQNKQTQNNYTSTEDAMNKYSNMSEGDLMGELFKEGSVSSGKVSGQELDNFYNTAGIYLNEEQRSKMKMLIEQLKRS